MRIIELRMNKAKIPDQDGKSRMFSAFELLDSLRKYTCSHIGEDVYNFHFMDDVIATLSRLLVLI